MCVCRVVGKARGGGSLLGTKRPDKRKRVSAPREQRAGSPEMVLGRLEPLSLTTVPDRKGQGHPDSYLG